VRCRRTASHLPIRNLNRTNGRHAMRAAMTPLRLAVASRGSHQHENEQQPGNSPKTEHGSPACHRSSPFAVGVLSRRARTAVSSQWRVRMREKRDSRRPSYGRVPLMRSLVLVRRCERVIPESEDDHVFVREACRLLDRSTPWHTRSHRCCPRLQDRRPWPDAVLRRPDAGCGPSVFAQTRASGHR
jgi:hypothetical protein